ncbi:hypothetical protein TIFTF001_020228 [Ficus carica]|uniref:Uncharacterized protein n=1 Tax=Ficus carica TaxID=3494 RepID=A0AA88A872_FICCA|nr:hypothetical protein TIFTF001_020228 [Ficus carica]
MSETTLVFSVAEPPPSSMYENAPPPPQSNSNPPHQTQIQRRLGAIKGDNDDAVGVDASLHEIIAPGKH